MQRYLSIYQDAKAAKDHDYGRRAVVQSLVLSPFFLYRFETGANGKGPLQAKELAWKLSYFLWGEPPDDALLAAVDDGSLMQENGYRAQVGRLMASPKVADHFADFMMTWLGLNGFDIGRKLDGASFPPGISDDMAIEVKMLVKDVLFTNKRGLNELFTAKYTFMNDKIAALYGANVSSSTFQKMNLDGSERLGILTTPLVLAAHTKDSGRSPIQRGHFIINQLLCLRPPPSCSKIEAGKRGQR
jgi:hypothetical protein